jgi:methyltransferase
VDVSYSLIFKAIVIFTTAQRLFELLIAKHNEKVLKADGAIIVKEKNYVAMVVLHTTWIISLLAMAFWGSLDIVPAQFMIFFIVFICGQAFRVVAISTLGTRWSTRIVILPNANAIRKGIFKYFRHPNYLGVVLEILALPMMIGAWELAMIFTLANFVILFFRVRLEEEMLNKYNNYNKIFSLNND